MNSRPTSAALLCMALACAATVSFLTSAVLATDEKPFALDPAKAAPNAAAPGNLLLAQAAEAKPAEAEAKSEKVVAEKEKPAVPISFGLTYALYSDYWWRGVNFSEYPGEGREKLNHQLTVSVAFDLGDFGKIGYNTWFEWYAAQKQLDPELGGQNCQEVDYTIWYTYSVKQIKTDVTLGMTFFEYMNLAPALREDSDPGNNNDDRSQEIYLTFEHNDAWMWKWLFPNNEDGVLNPTFLIAQDIGSIVGTWTEWGFSHDFKIPGIDNLTVTPGYKVAAQCSYWQPGCFLAGDTWSLITTYDLTPVLKLPAWAGTLTVGGELYYWNAYGNLASSGISNDLLWGGMTVNWAWGG
jgi:hypothetical protein